jgi:hypothetical protein
MNETVVNSLPSEIDTFTLDSHCSIPELKQLEGATPGSEHYDKIISGDAVGICGKTGRVIFILRQNQLSRELIKLADDVFWDIDKKLNPSYSRCSAAGRVSLERFTALRDDVLAVHPDSANPFQGYLELKNGKRFAKALSNPVCSYMAGYNYDRFRKLANPCGFTKLFPEEWDHAIPFFEGIETCLKHYLPDVAKHMLEWCKEHEIHSRFTIGNTCLSTVAINVNYDSCFHYDRGDLDDGYSTLTVVSSGKGYDGGFLVLPKYRVAIDVRPGSVLLNQSHVDLHGNTPINPLDTYSKRISFVTYLKKTLRHAVNK